MSKKIPEIDFIPRIIQIPEVFYSTATGDKFYACTMCGTELIENNHSYIIEKIIKNYPENNTKDTIAEYALCIKCIEKLREGFSEESLEKINNYMLGHTDLSVRRKQLVENNMLDVNAWLSNCIVNDKKINELSEYQIMCQCQGDFMLFTFMPYMLSCHAAEEMQELLSKKTRDELDRFYTENLGMPPELKELFKTKIPVI